MDEPNDQDELEELRGLLGRRPEPTEPAEPVPDFWQVFDRSRASVQEPETPEPLPSYGSAFVERVNAVGRMVRDLDLRRKGQNECRR